MTTDIEQEIRELFRDKAGQAPVATPDVEAAAPRQVLRRGRLHQVGYVVGSAVIAFALIVGSVAGLGSLLRGGGTVGGPGDYEVFERTATIEAFSLSSPSDWFLVNEWPRSVALANGSASASETCTVDPSGNQTCTGAIEPVDLIHPPSYGLPTLQLTNVDLGLGSNVCRDGLPDAGAALYIAVDATAGADQLDPFPPGPMPGMPSPAPNGPCGTGSYSRFTVNGYPMFSWVGWGGGASEQDRATVEQTWEQMWAHDDWQPSQPEHDTPAYVLAGGGPIGHEWRLELRPSQRNVELVLMGGTPLGALPGFSVPEVPIERCCGDQLTDPIFGAVTKEATGVEFRPGDDNTYYDLGASPVPGTIVPVPPSLGSFDFDLFFVDPPAGYASLGGHVLALGLETAPSVSPPPLAEPRAETVELTGSFEEQDWAVRFTGSFADETACIRVTIGDEAQGSEAYEPLCPRPLETSLAGASPSLHGSLTDGLYLLAGSVPPEIEDIRFVGDDDAVVPQQLRCATGPAGWTDPDRRVCALALLSSGSGTLRYLDTTGDVVYEEGIGWGAAEAEPSNQYPWTNEDTVITATGAFQGAEWKLEVLYYLEGYRLTIDGRQVFEGTLGLGEAKAFPLFEGDAAAYDAIVLVNTDTQVGSVSIATEGTWEGRWIPGSTTEGDGEARLWVIEIPGAGTGTLMFDGIAQGEVSWP